MKYIQYQMIHIKVVRRKRKKTFSAHSLRASEDVAYLLCFVNMNELLRVWDMFSNAGAAAPCLLFFDEFDSIAPKSINQVFSYSPPQPNIFFHYPFFSFSSLNYILPSSISFQFLTELDGVEVLMDVFVFAATK